MQDTESGTWEDVSHADPMDLPPKRRPFVAVDVELFTYVEEGRLTATAALLYVALLRYHNPRRADQSVWPSRRALARAVGIRKVDNIDPHLKALKDLGLISWTGRSVGKMKASNRYELHLIADTRRSEEVPPPAGYRAPAQRGLDTPWTEDELDTGELPQDEQDPKKDSKRTVPPTVASLPSAAAFENSTINSAERWGEADAKEPFTDWRANDREAFRLHAGERIKSDGNGGWKPGLFTAEAFYNAFRRRTKKPIRWPGAFLEDLYAKGEEQMIEDWFLEQGLDIKQ